MLSVSSSFTVPEKFHMHEKSNAFKRSNFTVPEKFHMHEKLNALDKKQLHCTRKIPNA
jgi:hypothetical protein